MPTRGQRALGWLVDKVALGNNYNPQTGQYSNVGRGLLGRAGQGLATYLAGPLAGQLARQAGENFANTGSPINFSQNQTKLGDLINALTGQDMSGQIGPVTRQPINSRGQLNITNLPGISVQAPQLGGTEAAWSGLGTGTGNVFSGGSLGNWASQAAPRDFGQSGGSFTPWGAGTIQVAGQGFGGQSAAQGFGLGSGGSGASAGADALADALRAARKNRV